MTTQQALVETTSALQDILTQHPELVETYGEVLQNKRFLAEHGIRPYEYQEVSNDHPAR